MLQCLIRIILFLTITTEAPKAVHIIMHQNVIEFSLMLIPSINVTHHRAQWELSSPNMKTPDTALYLILRLVSSASFVYVTSCEHRANLFTTFS